MHDFTVRQLNDHRLQQFELEADAARRAHGAARTGARGSLRVTVRQLAVSLLVTLVALVVVAGAAAAAEEDDIAAARAGTEAYADVDVAAADGYGLPPEGPLHECIASFDDTGAMGLHHINGDLVGDIELDPATPEALVFERAADGTLTLVALEYVVFAEAWDEANDHPPMLFDQMFMLVEEPNRYELPSFYALHAWIWKENPSGTYAGFNPEVSCAGAAPNTAVSAPAAVSPWLIAIGLVLILAAIGAAAVKGRRASL